MVPVDFQCRQALDSKRCVFNHYSHGPCKGDMMRLLEKHTALRSNSVASCAPCNHDISVLEALSAKLIGFIVVVECVDGHKLERK